jgi:Xaa-Pro aminopeptidase
MVKSALEIERIERACSVTEAGYRAGFSALGEGAKERGIIAVIVSEWLRLGADDPANGTNPGFLSLQAGRVAQMTPAPVERPMLRGDLVQVDGGAVYRGYGADIYRNAYIGDRLPGPLALYANGARRVLEAVVTSVRPGVTSADLCRTAGQATESLGFGRFRRQLTNAVGTPQDIYLGHGIGFSLIEPPHITPKDETPWVENMCGTVLVSFGDTETGYIEWEDNFVVTARGAKILTPSPKEVWLTG